MPLSYWHSLPAILLLPGSLHALTLDCSHIRDDGVSFNLKELGGPKTVHSQVYSDLPPTISNTTFTIDICNPLKKKKKDEDCPNGTRICAREWLYREDQDPYLEKVIPIAGEFTSSDGRPLNPSYTRLKGSTGNSDGKEGVIVELNGGTDHKTRTSQKAIVEFLCDRDVSGNEGFEDGDKMLDFTQYERMSTRADDDKSGPDLPDLDKDKNLQVVSYQVEGSGKVLRLRWKTRYACEDAMNDGDGKEGSWGFFTWFIIIVFLLAAAYIIFGSWLNYNRYGARGWDLIPHGDTIRDIPYILKDWALSCAERLRGGDSRGGYSAV